ncbi:PD-(D/E)XK nuclease family protein [Kitasatospora sp. NPDC097605]|uniref:PD-(D/E)XK nuclease family protein n=1 Tax=Kitasatospora sp. NPDC097605 TaxID=3157226 RepID=UPI00332A6D6F
MDTEAGAQRWAGVEAEALALPRARRGGRGPSALQILGQRRREGSHENYLKFLLDPREVHGLDAELLGALLRLAGRPELAGDPRLARARVHQQVRGDSSRPDLVVITPVASVVIELKVDAREGEGQTVRQGDDFADLANLVLVYLTPAGRPPADPRFRPVALRDLAGALARLLAERAPGPAAPGRRHADDYLSDLESTVGISTDDDAAGFWIRHGATVLAAQQAARRLLNHLPAHSHAALGTLAAELGRDLLVTSTEYTALGGSGSYPETAVVLSRPGWMAGGAPLLGFGLGVRRDTDGHPGPDPDDPHLRPFYGIYCTDDVVREAIGGRFLSKGSGGHWGWWQNLPLTAQPSGTGFLAHNAATVATLVRDTWHERVATVDTLWAARG